jgi:hypothetical protein
MNKKFPTFLYSESPNSENPGPFIVSTIFPKAIIKVNLINIKGKLKSRLTILECETDDSDLIIYLLDFAKKWLDRTHLNKK